MGFKSISYKLNTFCGLETRTMIIILSIAYFVFMKVGTIGEREFIIVKSQY